MEDDRDQGLEDPNMEPRQGSRVDRISEVSPPALKQYGGNRGVITTRPSRDSIVRSYSEQAAARARNARMASQKTFHDYQVNSMREQERRMRREELRASAASVAQGADGASIRDRDIRTTQRQHMGRANRPLTSEERAAVARRSEERYARERASRDALSANRISRSVNRQLIDARGSVDSRAFSEYDELVGYSVDEADRPDPYVDSSNGTSRWKSHAGQGFDGTRDRSKAPSIASKRQPVNRGLGLGSLTDAISGHDSYGNPKSGLAGLPVYVKIAIPVIVVLVIILLIILFG